MNHADILRKQYLLYPEVQLYNYFIVQLSLLNIAKSNRQVEFWQNRTDKSALEY